MEAPPLSAPIADPSTGGLTTSWSIWLQKLWIMNNIRVQPASTPPANNLYVGASFFDTTLGYPYWYNGSAWTPATPAGALPLYGPTANRPTTNLYIGLFYFDEELKYPVWWDGRQWRNASGV